MIIKIKIFILISIIILNKKTTWKNNYLELLKLIS
jgi:hypothetical protein